MSNKYRVTILVLYHHAWFFHLILLGTYSKHPWLEVEKNMASHNIEQKTSPLLSQLPLVSFETSLQRQNLKIFGFFSSFEFNCTQTKPCVWSTENNMIFCLFVYGQFACTFFPFSTLFLNFEIYTMHGMNINKSDKFYARQ